jgi:hypothetical protein
MIGIIDSVKMQDFEDTAHNIVKAGKLGYAEDVLNGNSRSVDGDLIGSTKGENDGYIIKCDLNSEI